VQVVASHGIESALAAGIRFNYGVGLMRHFEMSPILADRATAFPPVEKQMALLGARLAMPLIRSGAVAGALLVGEKSSGSPYSAEDRDLLALIARAGGIAFESAHRYRETSNRQDQLDSILAHMSSGLAVVAADKTVSMLNESAEHILKLRAAETVGRSVQKLGSRIADIALRCLADGTPILRQEIYDPAVGDTIGISASPLAGNGVVLVFSRIPKAHTAPDEVTYSPYWEYLSARVAQEIKNPLVAINTFAQLFPKKFDSEEFRNQFGEVVQKEVERINRVVETLFDFARQPRLEIQPTRIAETLKRVLDSFGEKFHAAGIAIQFDSQVDNLTMEVDPLYFSQAVHNVVQNAIDAMPGGGALSVTARTQNEELEILIADSGPGIPDDIVPLIFLPFYGTREYGMGLGLAVAGRIASQHGGRLDLTKHKDGCTFSLRIPLQTKRQRAANPTEEGRAHATTG
jgi:nitrogen fixation/metabolism regulation signal transduction histidine kinase